MEIRKATEADIPAITFIYNDAVKNTTATFDTDPKDESNRRAWLLERSSDFPVIVSVEQDVVTGYASLSRWSDKKAYDITAELSLYIHPEHRGKGIGKALLSALLKLAENTNLHSIISRITEGNEVSIYLHRNEGFDTVGILKQSGRKFGKLLDVTIMQKMLR